MHTYQNEPEYHKSLQYLQGFVKECMDKGLTAEQTANLLDSHVLNEVIRKSPEYQEGAKQAMQAVAAQQTIY